MMLLSVPQAVHFSFLHRLSQAQLYILIQVISKCMLVNHMPSFGLLALKMHHQLLRMRTGLCSKGLTFCQSLELKIL